MKFPDAGVRVCMCVHNARMCVRMERVREREEYVECFVG